MIAKYINIYIYTDIVKTQGISCINCLVMYRMGRLIVHLFEFLQILHFSTKTIYSTNAVFFFFKYESIVTIF